MIRRLVHNARMGLVLDAGCPSDRVELSFVAVVTPAGSEPASARRWGGDEDKSGSAFA